MTAKNYNNSSFDQLRKVGDPISDSAVEYIFNGNLHHMKDMHSPDILNKRLPSKIQNLIDDTKKRSCIIDKTVLNSGQRLFARHATDILFALFHAALPECYAASRGSKVLVQNKNMVNNPRKRLFETSTFVKNVMDKNNFDNNNNGVFSCLELRFIHSLIRRNINEIDLGEIPINQEDMLGTIIAFSEVCLNGLENLGMNFDEKEADSFIMSWTYMGHMIGINKEILPQNRSDSQRLRKFISDRNHEFSNDGITLMQELRRFQKKSLPIPGIHLVLDELTSKMTHEKVSKALDLKSSKFAKRILSIISKIYKIKAFTINNLPFTKKIIEKVEFMLLRNTLFVQSIIENKRNPEELIKNKNE